MPELMRAAILETPGGGLHVERIPIPRPRSGEVLLKLRACGVCHTDLHVIKAEVAFPMPCVLGHEVSGTVVEVGPGVKTVRTGDQVVGTFIMPCGFCRHCAQGRDDLCETFFTFNRGKGTLYDGETRLARTDGSPVWMYSMGGLAEYVVTPETSVYPLPSGLDPVSAAIVGCAMMTAFGAVRNGADLRIGERVAVIAVGGVGLNIVQMARAFGAGEIIAVDLSDEKLAVARRLGATHTVNGAREDVVAAIRERTRGAGIDVSFEALGRPETFKQALDVLRDGGRMVAVGIAAGTTAAPVEITRLVRRSLRITGSYGARVRTDMPALLDLIARGALDVDSVITRRVSLEQAHETYAALSRGEITGRAVVQLS